MFDFQMVEKFEVTCHGAAKSGYDRTIRAFASQYRSTLPEVELSTVKSSIEDDIRSIPRKNTGVASVNYSVKLKDLCEPSERLEIWNEVMPGKERLIVTIKLKH